MSSESIGTWISIAEAALLLKVKPSTNRVRSTRRPLSVNRKALSQSLPL